MNELTEEQRELVREVEAEIEASVLEANGRLSEGV